MCLNLAANKYDVGRGVGAAVAAKPVGLIGVQVVLARTVRTGYGSFHPRFYGKYTIGISGGVL
jgi:hypothetical protein